MPIVQRPLASLIARADGPVRRPRDLEGRSVGVTGLPSDEAVVDSEVSADGGDPGRARRVTIGFDAVSSLAAGKVDAATGFWNAEGVALRRQGVPVRIFEVDRYGAPPYPELVLTASEKTIEREPGPGRRDARGDERGYAFVTAHPRRGLYDLLVRSPRPRPRRPGGAASRSAPRPQARPRSTPPCCAIGPRGTSNTACSSARSIVDAAFRLSR